VDFSLDDTTIRIFLHLLGVTVWVGGQIVLGALIPVIRRLGDDAPRKAARQFNRVSWPFFGLAVITGIWNTAEVDFDATTTGWKAALFVKLILVAVSGVTAWMHTRARGAPARAAFAAGTLLASLGALLLGTGLVT
jgi:putative copper export protein